MKMNLNNFESCIDRKILARGLDYYENDYISSIEQVDENMYEAEVAGTDLYLVQVKLDDQGNITETQCDCPYDMGEYCKHQAAVFFALRKTVNKTPAKLPHRPASAPKEKSADIKKILSDRTKDELVDFLSNIASENNDIKQQIELNFGAGNDEDEINRCVNLIRTYIQKNSDQWGFVHYGETDKAVKGAEIVLDRARNAFLQNKTMHSLELGLCIIHEMIDMLHDSDDSDGGIDDIVTETFGLIDEIIDEEDLSPEDKKSIFNKLIAEASNERYDGWADWRLELLEKCSRLAEYPALRKEMENHLTSMIKMEKGDSWSTNYFAENINLIRYQMIEKHDGRKNAQEFIERNLQFSGFRVMAIKNAMEKKDYDLVIELAQDGEEKDKNLLGLVKQWKEFRYQAYKNSAKLEEQRDIAIEFVLAGSFEYYLELKSTYEIKDWPSIYSKIIFLLENQNKTHQDVYTRILIAEGEKQKLLDYVKTRPSSIEYFYKHLVPDYQDEVNAIFIFYIEQTAARANSRKNYQEVCSIIRTLKKAGGNEEAVNVIQVLLVKYSKKPAFRDELTKITY